MFNPKSQVTETADAINDSPQWVHRGGGGGGREGVVSSFLDHKQESVSGNLKEASPVVSLQMSYPLGVVALGFLRVQSFQGVSSTSPKSRT